MRLFRIGVVAVAVLALGLAGCQKKCKPGQDPGCWAEALADAEQQERAIEELKALGDVKAAPRLLEVFKASADNPKNRENIAEIFGKWQYKEALKPMLEALDYTTGPDKDGKKAKATNRANQKIASALALLGDKQAVEPLLRLMRSTKEENVRRSAMRSLGVLKATEATDELLSILKDKSAHQIIRANAVFALGEIADPKSVPALVEALYQEKAMFFAHAGLALVRIGEPAVDLLVKTMNGENPDAKRITEENPEVLAGALESNAAKVLGDIGSPLAVEPLLKLSDKVMKWEAETNQMLVMTRVINSLGSIGDPRGVPVVVKFLEKEFWDVRTVCANALNLMSDRAAIDSMWKYIEKGEHPRNRVPLIEAVGNLGTDVALPKIKELSEAQKENILSPAYQDTIKRLETYAACKDSVDCWIGKLKDPAVPVREKAAYELGRLGDKKALDPLIGLLGDQNENVRFAIIFALDKMHSRKPLEAIEELVAKEKGSARFKVVNFNYELLAARLARAGA
ncbi:MAG TPA: HEAT repeat domain-containing protein [Myxococcota bacterium]|nr:HEAT repeat domain-containing protein [Myxococcota bacterium]HRY95413.1 HEAT repeat domain-containing protein [Myxococcota bacterium]HSA21995.1 HEAT repeat domain-containing protein [Myxococcota bacterium]